MDTVARQRRRVQRDTRLQQYEMQVGQVKVEDGEQVDFGMDDVQTDGYTVGTWYAL